MAIDKEHSSIILKRITENVFCGDQITLISGKDDQRIPIHRCILTAVSKYFLALLGPNFQEGSETEFILDNTDGETIKAIVDFCFTGRINLTEENVSKLQTIASSIEVDLLEEKCRQFYEDNLSVNNSIGTWMLADKYSYGDLRKRALNLICESFEKVPASDILSLEHRCVQELLKCDKIQANEELVFKRLLEWFQNADGEREPYMAALLKLIRLEYIPSQLLNDSAFAAAYKRFDCSEFFIAELKRRSLDKCLNIGVRRGQSIFCLFAQHKGEEGVDYSAIKVEKYSRVLNCFEEAAEITLGDRSGFRVIYQKNQIYVLGGWANGVSLKSVSAFDMNSGEEEILPDMNFVRCCFAPILLGKYIYVFGALSGTEAMDSCECFDTETKTWKIIQPMNTARYLATATVLNGYIYVAGGRMDSNTMLNSVELYDPKSDEWIQLPAMNKPRSGFALAKWNGFLYAMGNENIVEKFDPWKNCWTEIGTFNESGWITSAFKIDSEVVAIMTNGKFGQIKFDGIGGCSFVRLSKSKYECEYLRQHYLCQN